MVSRRVAHTSRSFGPTQRALIVIGRDHHQRREEEVRINIEKKAALNSILYLVSFVLGEFDMFVVVSRFNYLKRVIFDIWECTARAFT